MGTLIVEAETIQQPYPPDSWVGAGSPLTPMRDVSDATYAQETSSVTPFLLQCYTNQDFGVDIQAAMPAGARIFSARPFLRQSNNFTYGFGTPAVNFVGSVRSAGNGGAPAGLQNAGWSYRPSYINDGTIHDIATDPLQSLTSMYNGQQYPMHVVVIDAGQDLYWEVYGWAPTGTEAGKQARYYRTWLEIVYNERPVVAVTAPSGTTVTSQPTVTWTYTDPELDPQTHYQVKIFDAATYGAAGFNPDTATPAWDSGRVAGSGTSARTGTLTNGTTYKAYVKAWQEDVGGGEHHSAWDDGSAFTIAIDPPAAPFILPTLDLATGSVKIDIQGRDNELTYNQSSIETNTVGLTAGTNTTIARTTAAGTFLHGTAGLSITKTVGAGTASAVTLTGTAGIPVVAGRRYLGLVSAKAAGTFRDCQVIIYWYDAAGAFISNSAGPVVADSASWTQLSAVAIAPALAAFAAIEISIASAAVAEVHYADKFSFAPLGSKNLLTYNQSSLETDLTGWAWTAGQSTIARTTAAETFLNGVAGLAITKVTGAGTSAAYTPTGTTGFRVEAGKQYTAVAHVKAATAGRVCSLQLYWYDAAGATISNSGSVGFNDVTTGWTGMFLVAVAPVGAVYAAIQIQIDNCALNEVHYADMIGVLEGADSAWVPGWQATWTRGGLVNTSQRFILERRSGNMLATRQADLEAYTGITAADGFSVVGGAGVVTGAASSEQARVGTKSIKVTAISGAGVVCGVVAPNYSVSDPTLAAAVTPGQTYTVMASVRPETTARFVVCGFFFYKADGALSGINPYPQGGGNNVLGQWTDFTYTTTAPADAAYAGANLYVVNVAPGESHYFDRLGIFAGTVKTGDWEMPSAWTPVRELDLADLVPPGGQLVTITDSEFRHGVGVRYRARTLSLADGVSPVEGANTAESVDLVMPATRWWLKDPRNSSRNTPIRVSAPPDYDRPKPSVAGFGFGDPFHVVSHDGLKARATTLQIDALDRAAHDALLLLLESEALALVLVDVFGEVTYVEPGSVKYELMHAAPTTLEATTIRHFHRFTVEFSEVEPL